MLQREGNAGANTVADHLRVLTEALAQIPHCSSAKILVRVDGAGATHDLLTHLEALNTTRRMVRYTVGWKIGDADEQAIEQLPEAAWETSLHQDGNIQDGYAVAELTALNIREGWPDGMQLKSWADQRTPHAYHRPDRPATPRNRQTITPDSDGWIGAGGSNSRPVRWPSRCRQPHVFS